MDAQARTYPLPRPATWVDDDPRFTMGLILAVKKVLEEHGYPPITHGFDLVDLQQSLFGFLYAPKAAGDDVGRQTCR